MFDFSIEFAMEAFIIVLLGVAISMFVAFITNIDKELALHDKNIDKELALHDQKSSAENTSLSKEHASLSSSLSRGYAALSQELSQISGDIKVVRERQAEDRIKQKCRSKALPKVFRKWRNLLSSSRALRLKAISCKQKTISCGDSFNFKGKEYWSWNGNAMKPNNPLFLQFGEGLFLC